MRSLRMNWLGAGLVVLLLGAAAPAWAQQDDAHTAAAKRLIKVMKLDTQYKQGLVSSMEAQVQTDPQLAPFKEIMLEWALTHVGWDAIEADFIELYKSAFTADELNQLADFYETPLGQKTVEKLPELAQKGMEIGMRRSQEKAPLLQQMITERMQQLQGPNAPKQPAQPQQQ